MSGLFQDERAAVSEIDFRGFPSGFGALVPEFESGVGSGFVIVGWNPGADRLPWRVDGLEGFDVERWVRWRREADEPFPQAKKAEETPCNLPGNSPHR